jgi:hypothetical protein
MSEIRFQTIQEEEESLEEKMESNDEAKKVSTSQLTYEELNAD